MASAAAAAVDAKNYASTAAAAAAAASTNDDAVRSRDWMFCPVTGALLELDAERDVAWSPVSGFERKLEGMIRMERHEKEEFFFGIG